ncbi:MAG: helix-turn-helix domain-containing protein [Mycobacteriales bacterium]
MLLTVEQAAERLGTSVRFIRRLRTEGRIPVIKLGKHIRIDDADLDAYVTAGRQDAWANHLGQPLTTARTAGGVPPPRRA